MSDGVMFRGQPNGLTPLDQNGNVPAGIGNVLTVPTVLTTTTTLTAANSGSVYQFASATGVLVNLPPPVLGLNYFFVVSVAVTSGSYKILTDASTTFMQGIASFGEATVGVTEFFQATPTTTRSFNMNGTTTTGLIGTQIECICVASNPATPSGEWQVTATGFGSGTLATPWATS